jgi:hypothetical protein
MRRQEAERIDERPAKGASPKPARCRYRASPASVGLGPEMRPRQGLKVCPPTQVDGQGREPKVWSGARVPCLARTAPGRPGSPSDPTMGVCLEWLDEARMKGGESHPDKSGQKTLVLSRKHGPGARNRHKQSSLRRLRKLVCVERRKASLLRQGGARHAKAGGRDRKARHRCAVRRSAPLALRGEEKERATPGARKISPATGRRSVGCVVRHSGRAPKARGPESITPTSRRFERACHNPDF